MKNFQSKKMFQNRKNNGFVVLFTVLVTSVILLIAIGISSITFKETQLAASARDAHYAFFSADTGAECALYFDRIRNIFEPSPGSGDCAGNSFNPVFTDNGDSYLYTFSLELDDNTRCAFVSVEKEIGLRTTIESLGYNVSCEGAVNPNNKIRVERAIRVSY